MNSKAVYATLRQELLDSYNRQANLITFTFTATAAIIGYGFAAQKPLIFLLPIIILWLSLMQLNNTMYSVFTISVYIRRAIESTKGFPTWERDISALRAHLRDNEPIEKLKAFNPIISFDGYHYAKAIVGMGIACIFLSVLSTYFWELPAIELLITYGASVAAIIFWGTRSKKLFNPIAFINSGNFEEELQEEWDKIQPIATKPKVKRVSRRIKSTRRT